MGKRVTIEYEDDLDGGEIDAAVVDTVDFSYRGSDYTLVLTPENGAQFDADIARWITAAKKAVARDAKDARKTKGTRARKATGEAKKARPGQGRIVKAAKATPAARGRGRKSAAVVAPADKNQAIRQWAVANGYAVAERGRLSASVVAAFNAAH